MGFKDFLYNKVAPFVWKNTDLGTLKVLAATKGGTSPNSKQLNKEAESMQVQTLNEWKLALTMASDPEEPSRVELSTLYKNLKLDNHTVAQFENRTEPVQGAPFRLIDKEGNENEEAKELLEAMWFIDFIKLCMDSKWEGTKVVELMDLDDNMMLKTIEDIPMAHIIPQKGMITKDAGGTTGWNYKEGAFADYYIQIGKDNFLGMLAQLAPIILAKKLGIGSWLDYIEKYGVPPIFAITDREDKERMDDLYEALLNFKSNNFMVGRGQEKFEIGKDMGGGSSDLFDKLVERANSEIGKRINGATGTSDEKSHVGAAQVHADILKTKHKLDKFFVKVIINNDLIPRLVKLSPAYAALENLKFEWDETETLNLKEILEAIKSLSSFYEFDIEELVKMTGLPITAIKSNMTSTESSDPEEPNPKKKS